MKGLRLLFRITPILGGLVTAAAVPAGLRPREVFVSEVAGDTGSPNVGEGGLLESGGPELLPVVGILLGAGVLVYALLRRLRRA